MPLLFKWARWRIINYVSDWYLRFISVLPRNFSPRFANFLCFFQASQGDTGVGRRRFLFFILTVQLECHQVTLRINRWRVRRCAEFKEIATKMLTEKSSSIIITSNCIYIYLSDDSTNWLHQWAVFLSSILKRVRVIEWCTRRRCSDSRETSTLTFELRRSPTHYSIYIE